mmetsp:Transcript_854/g.1553  ORF Transcript_854/g.1553 Transcript_854/m.1553 type:complete len:90 (+) Transcript_854:39-308(+)
MKSRFIMTDNNVSPKNYLMPPLKKFNGKYYSMSTTQSLYYSVSHCCLLHVESLLVVFLTMIRRLFCQQIRNRHPGGLRQNIQESTAMVF